MRRKLSLVVAAVKLNRDCTHSYSGAYPGWRLTQLAARVAEDTAAAFPLARWIEGSLVACRSRPHLWSLFRAFTNDFGALALKRARLRARASRTHIQTLMGHER